MVLSPNSGSNSIPIPIPIWHRLQCESVRSGDVLVAMGRSWGTGDEDITAPALGLDRGGDVLVAMGGSFGNGR